MARERIGNGRPKNGRKDTAGKRSGEPATAPPTSPDASEPTAPPEGNAAEARPGDPREQFPVESQPEAPMTSHPEGSVEDFKLLSSFHPGKDGEAAVESPAAESPAAGTGPIIAPPVLAPLADAAPAPAAMAFPTEDAWNASGGELEESGSDLLCFMIADEEYAIDIQRVWEIIRLRPVTEIPGVPEFISGIIALRGEIVPVLDLRRRLGFSPARAAQASAKIIVAVQDGRRIGMAVDAVSHKIHVLEDQVTQPTALLGGQESGFLAGVCRHRERLIAILNADAVLDFRIGGEGTPVDIPHGALGDRGAQGGTR